MDEQYGAQPDTARVTPAASRMTFGSLFAGIGGFDLGLERAGMQCKWQVEIDPFCRAVLAKHWPDVRRYEDVRTVGNELERVDVICGGFPCQDISFAGKGLGLAGERSGLWFHFDRLIGELRPRYVVVENVAALLARGMGRVLGDLASRRYDAEWDCLPARAFGAPHQRDRVWIVAYPDSWGQQECSELDRQQAHSPSLRHSCWRHADRCGHEVAHADEPRLEGRRREELRECASQRPARPSGSCPRIFLDSGRFGGFQQAASQGGRRSQRRIGDSDWWRVEPDVGRVAYGVPRRVDRLKGLGNAIVPQIAEWIGRRIIEAESGTVAIGPRGDHT